MCCLFLSAGAVPAAAPDTPAARDAGVTVAAAAPADTLGAGAGAPAATDAPDTAAGAADEPQQADLHNDLVHLINTAAPADPSTPISTSASSSSSGSPSEFLSAKQNKYKRPQDLAGMCY